MNSDKVDMYFVNNSKYFPSDKLVILREKMSSADDSRFAMLSSIDLKDPVMLFFVSFFLGGFGIDRFMLGDIGMGILKLLTFGLCGFLALIDLFLIMRRTKEKNFQTVMLML